MLKTCNTNGVTLGELLAEMPTWDAEDVRELNMANLLGGFITNPNCGEVACAILDAWITLGLRLSHMQLYDTIRYAVDFGSPEMLDLVLMMQKRALLATKTSLAAEMTAKDDDNDIYRPMSMSIYMLCSFGAHPRIYSATMVHKLLYTMMSIQEYTYPKDPKDMVTEDSYMLDILWHADIEINNMNIDAKLLMKTLSNISKHVKLHVCKDMNIDVAQLAEKLVLSGVM